MTVTQVVRVDAGLYYGGGEIQANCTRDALTRRGIDVRRFSSWDRNLGDVVHFFGNFPYFDDIASHLRSRRIPYVVSPIFVSPRSTRRLRWRSFRQKSLGQFPRQSHSFLKGASALVSLSEHEEKTISAYFGSRLPPFVRIPNGVEQRFSKGDASAFRSRVQIDQPFAIHLGTIDRSKNQLNSIQAAGNRFPLMIVGRESSAGYAEDCRRLAKSNVRFLGSFDHSDPIVADALAAAHVFILPSYRELFPLSALEATVAGCHLLLSNRWGGHRIWGEDATFVDPGDCKQIQVELSRLMKEPRPAPERADHYLRTYSWDCVAEQIEDVYRETLSLARLGGTTRLHSVPSHELEETRESAHHRAIR